MGEKSHLKVTKFTHSKRSSIRNINPCKKREKSKNRAIGMEKMEKKRMKRKKAKNLKEKKEKSFRKERGNSEDNRKKLWMPTAMLLLSSSRTNNQLTQVSFLFKFNRPSTS